MDGALVLDLAGPLVHPLNGLPPFPGLSFPLRSASEPLLVPRAISGVLSLVGNPSRASFASWKGEVARQEGEEAGGRLEGEKEADEENGLRDEEDVERGDAMGEVV